MQALAGGAGAAGGGINELLDDFNALFDTEWTFITALCSTMISFVGILCSSLIMMMSRIVNLFWWKLTLGLSTLVFVASLIFLVEPRPSHWMATMGQIEHWLWVGSFGEQRMRIRRWWRWRKKYAMRTKLNV